MGLAQPKINRFIPRGTMHRLSLPLTLEIIFREIPLKVMSKSSGESTGSALKHHLAAFPSKMAQKISPQMSPQMAQK
jgi:hypothetical protein